jgi:hypothetical protein
VQVGEAVHSTVAIGQHRCEVDELSAVATNLFGWVENWLVAVLGDPDKVIADRLGGCPLLEFHKHV